MSEIVELNDERALQEVGIYRYHHPVENSEEYRERLSILQEKLKAFVLAGNAILASDMFTFNGSLAKGRKMTADFSKLMLRAYNAEADNCVRTVSAGNVLTATKRLDAAVVSIQRLGSMMEMRINPDYHLLRIEEIQLTADYQMKVQQEREEAREERERLRCDERPRRNLRRSVSASKRNGRTTPMRSRPSPPQVAHLRSLRCRPSSQNWRPQSSRTITGRRTFGPDVCM